MKPRRRYPRSPDTTAVDYVVFCISTYPADLELLDQLVDARRQRGGRVSRSSVIRELVRAEAGRER